MSILIINAKCNDIKLKDTSLKIQVNNIKKISSAGKIKQGTFYSADIDLVNNTDSTISFWIMDCAWQWNFITNKSGIHLYFEGCDYNSTTIRKIERNQKLTYNAVFVLSDSLNVNNNFKLGFILIKEKEIKLVPGHKLGFDDLLKYKKKKKKDIIWSEPIKFP